MKSEDNSMKSEDNSLSLSQDNYVTFFYS